MNVCTEFNGNPISSYRVIYSQDVAALDGSNLSKHPSPLAPNEQFCLWQQMETTCMENHESVFKSVKVIEIAATETDSTTYRLVRGHTFKTKLQIFLWVHELYLNSDLSLQKKNEYTNYTPDKYFTIMFTLIFFFLTEILCCVLCMC